MLEDNNQCQSWTSESSPNLHKKQENPEKLTSPKKLTPEAGYQSLAQVNSFMQCTKQAFQDVVNRKAHTVTDLGDLLSIGQDLFETRSKCKGNQSEKQVDPPSI